MILSGRNRRQGSMTAQCEVRDAVAVITLDNPPVNGNESILKHSGHFREKAALQDDRAKGRSVPTTRPIRDIHVDDIKIRNARVPVGSRAICQFDPWCSD
jgi:hypothetical protein